MINKKNFLELLVTRGRERGKSVVKQGGKKKSGESGRVSVVSWRWSEKTARERVGGHRRLRGLVLGKRPQNR